MRDKEMVTVEVEKETGLWGLLILMKKGAIRRIGWGGQQHLVGEDRTGNWREIEADGKLGPRWQDWEVMCCNDWELYEEPKPLPPADGLDLPASVREKWDVCLVHPSRCSWRKEWVFSVRGHTVPYLLDLASRWNGIILYRMPGGQLTYDPCWQILADGADPYGVPGPLGEGGETIDAGPNEPVAVLIPKEMKA